jgi:hypothetical protein
MNERRCPHCQKLFYPSRCQQEQIVCSDPGCQRERRSNYRRNKIAADPNYREACRQSARQWRKQHPDYWKQYRQIHPAAVERKRLRQKSRDRKQHLKHLANNISASDLRPCPATAASYWRSMTVSIARLCRVIRNARTYASMPSTNITITPMLLSTSLLVPKLFIREAAGALMTDTP